MGLAITKEVDHLHSEVVTNIVLWHLTACTSHLFDCSFKHNSSYFCNFSCFTGSLQGLLPAFTTERKQRHCPASIDITDISVSSATVFPEEPRWHK